MRILLFAGKGGVGKTSVAAATGLALARQGKSTLIMSLDPAHSLSDSFDLKQSLMDLSRGGVVPVEKNLAIQEIDVLEEVHRHWGEVHQYLSVLISGSGLDEVLADELAIIPGMEEASCLLYINQYVKQKAFDYLVLDCAPTGESLRFIAFPSILRWYMSRLWKIEKSIVRVARPVLKHVIDVPLPSDAYFDSIRTLFDKIEGVDDLLLNPMVTTVRLVTNLEKMVIRETQRAYMYFCLYGLQVDALVVNRLLPAGITDHFFDQWKKTQTGILSTIRELFGEVPLLTVPLMPDEVVGVDRLAVLAQELYRENDPGEILHQSPPFKFKKLKGKHVLTLSLPFLSSEEVDVTRVEDQLIVRVASLKRYIPLPKSIPPKAEIEAGLTDRGLTVTFY